MNSMQSNVNCEVDDPNNMIPTKVETSLQFPLDSSMCIVFTGYFNGIGVEVRSPDEMKLIYHMGCFGKGTESRSRPKANNNDDIPMLMRRRQFLKRNYWYKRFGKLQKAAVNPDTFFKDIDNIVKKILTDTKTQTGKDVIDLVSSEDECQPEAENVTDDSEFDVSLKQNIVVIVPNSDSEDDNYFANMKPKCCINNVILQEKLILTLQEAFFLFYGLGCLQILNFENSVLSIEECWKLFTECEANFIEKYIVYHYFRSKGYVVKPGIKFGGEYLIYREGPEVNHADYLVVIKFDNYILDWISLLGHVRMATTTVKEILMTEVIRSDKKYIKLPQDLREYSVREILVTRKMPVILNNEDD